MLLQPYRFIRILTIVAALLSLSGAVSFGADIDEALRLRFFNGIADAQKIVGTSSVRAQYTMTDEYPKGDRPSPVVEEYKCVIRGELVKELTRKAGIEVELVKNPDYGFRVTKSLNSENYSLTFVAEIGNSDSELERKVQYVEDGIHAIVFGCWHFQGKFLWDWPEQEGFQMKSISSKKIDGHEIVRVEFDYLPSDQTEIKMTDAFIECDAGNGWCLRKYGLTLRDDSTKLLVNVTTQQGNNGFVLANLISNSFTSGDTGEVTFKRTVQVEILERTDFTDEEFYLTHYGLPEPNFESKPFPMWLLYLFAGVSCLGAAYFW